jgi:class 3 adenylate cyclase
MPRLLDRFALFYPLRFGGSLFMIGVMTLYAWQFQQFDALYFATVATFVVYPHVVQHIARTYPQKRLHIETSAFLADSFLLGVVIEFMAFTPLPALILITVGLVNALEVNGPRQMLLSAIALLAGIAVPLALVGVSFPSEEPIALDIAFSVFLFVYFTIFAYSSYNRNALLIQSQTELREKKEFLEIEKLRSDRLLYNLVPTQLAAEMVRTGSIKPTTFEPVTLIAIELRGVSRALRDHDVNDVFAHLMHCFKAFDAISSRRGLEKLKTMGDIYVALAGLPTASGGDAAAVVEAALEIRRFLADLNESRRAHGHFDLDAGITVHSGTVIGGVVETAKLSYDVWGEGMKTLLALLRACPDNQIVISDATRRLAADEFAWTRAGELNCPPATPIVFHHAEARAH